MNQLGTGRHHIGRLIAETGRGRTRIGMWAACGLMAGCCLGFGYGLVAGMAIGGIGGGISGAVFGFLIGLIIGPLIGFLIGLGQVLLRRTAIPDPLIAVAVTELILLPPQLLAARVGWHQYTAVLVYIPSALGVGTAAALGFRLSPTERSLRRPEPGPELPGSPGDTQPFGATGLRLRAYRPGRSRGVPGVRRREPRPFGRKK